MKSQKIQMKTMKAKKSLFDRIYVYLKKYAENCRYSFEGMLKI